MSVYNYEDMYKKNFAAYDEMINEIEKNTGDTEWIPGINSKEIRISAIEPIEAQETADKTGISYDVVFDTTNNTKLMMSYGNNVYMLRDTAIMSILETAKIGGKALRRLSPYQLSNVLNECLTVARGDSLLLYRGSKVCACLSDGIYKVMPIKELLDITIKTLSEKFGELKFIEGQHDYKLTSALWELPEAQDVLLEKYNDVVPSHSSRLYGRTFMPAVRFVTSDIGICAATLIPVFKISNNTYFRINDGIKVEHKRLGGGHLEGIELFEQEAEGIFAKFADMEKTLAAMAVCEIEHPLNALVCMCKKAGIPKKYASDAYEEIERFTMGRPCYMDDIYLSIANSTATTAKQQGASQSKVMELEETVAKILTYAWKDFDIAGVVAWN